VLDSLFPVVLGLTEVKHLVGSCTGLDSKVLVETGASFSLRARVQCPTRFEILMFDSDEDEAAKIARHIVFEFMGPETQNQIMQPVPGAVFLPRPLSERAKDEDPSAADPQPVVFRWPVVPTDACVMLSGTWTGLPTRLIFSLFGYSVVEI